MLKNIGKETEMDIKEGSRWWSGDNKKFVVLHLVEQQGHTWVHYRDESTSNKFALAGCREYSCYKESFLQRFSPLPE